MISFAPVTGSVSSNHPLMRQASERRVQKYSENNRKVSVRAAIDVAERVVTFLRRRYPAKTAEAVASDTSIAISTVGRWLEGATVPGGLAFIRLVEAYGPEFLHAVLPDPPRWLDEAHRAERQRALETAIARQQAELDALKARI